MAEWITRDTKCVRSVVLATPSLNETELVLGDTIGVGDTIVYSLGAEGGYYIVYDMHGNVLDQRIAPAVASPCERGGSIPVIGTYARIVLGPTIRANKSTSVTIGDIVDAAESLDDLCHTLAMLCVNDEDAQQIINIYLASNGGSGGTGKPGKDGATYTPHMSEAGDLSWTNDGGLENPRPVNLVGPSGKNGATYTPHISDIGDLSWTNDGGLDNPQPVSLVGASGKNGITYTPHMSESGDLSWTNDGGLPNPETVNIMGPTGSSTIDLSIVYPVGSIYMSVLETNPADLFGFGTWERIKDCFLLSAGDKYIAGGSGGESEHTLTIDEIPAHAHKVANYTGYTGWSGTSPHSYFSNDATSYIASTTVTSADAGGGLAHNNMPPYLAVYVWKRTN